MWNFTLFFLKKDNQAWLFKVSKINFQRRNHAKFHYKNSTKTVGPIIVHKNNTYDGLLKIWFVRQNYKWFCDFTFNFVVYKKYLKY